MVFRGNDPSKESPTTNKATQQLINEGIRAPQVQLITADGTNVGVVSRMEALTQARSAGLDLVMLAESGALGIPVVKILDHGKELYKTKKKQTEAKKNQKVILVKEIKIRPKIGEHDYERKINQAIEFLKEGNRLKITVQFHGREVAFKAEQGGQLFDKINRSFQAHGLSDRLGEEKEANAGKTWSKMFFLKK